MANDLPTNYEDGQIVHGSDIDSWTTAINSKSNFLGPVASQSAMLALTADRGDFCYRTDLSDIFFLTASPATTLGNWETAMPAIASALSGLGTSVLKGNGSGGFADAVSGTDFQRAHWINVLDYGADPSGTNDSTTAFTNALAALPTGGPTNVGRGGVIYAPSGTYKISSTVTFLPNQVLKGDGQNLTIISHTGTGPCFTTSNPTGANGNQMFYWGFIDFSIDGSSAGTGAMGVRLTDVFNLKMDIEVRYYNTTGAIAVGYVTNIDPPSPQGVLANGETGTWQMWDVKLNALYNTTALDFYGGNGGYSKFDIYCECQSNQYVVTSRNKVVNGESTWRIRGFAGATSPTNNGAVFAIDLGDSAGVSYWEGCSFDIIFQTGAQPPGTPLYPTLRSIVLGGSGSHLSGFGMMDFLTQGFTGANLQGASIAATAQFAVGGYISDPGGLGGLTPGWESAAFQGGTQWSVHGSNTLTLPASLSLNVALADVHEYQLASGPTVFTGFLLAPFLRSKKVEIILHQPASGAAGTVTWPSNVQWVGGNGSLSTANGAVDKVRFVYMPTTDTWYGEIAKNYTATPQNTAAYLTLTSPQTSAYTAQVGDLVVVDCTAGAVTITAPVNPVDGSRFAVKREDATFNAAVVATINCSSITTYFESTATSTTLQLQGQVKTYQYKASIRTWYAVSSDLAVSTLDSRYQSAVAANIVPAANEAYALGSTTLGWQALHLGGPTYTTQLLPNGATVANQTLSLPNPTVDVLVSRNSLDTLTNKTLTSPTLTNPALGTPASGNLSNCTFPTLNQSTTGNAATATNLAAPQTINGINFDGSTPITTEWFVSNTSAYTLASQTAAQQLFAVTTNGAITLPVGVFFFECLFSLTGMSSTSSSFGFAFGGTAVVVDQAWEAVAAHALGNAANAQISWNTGPNTAIATASTVTNGTAKITGKVRITTTGTLIPQVSLGVAAAAIVGNGSLFRIWQVASTAGTQSVGNWS